MIIEQSREILAKHGTQELSLRRIAEAAGDLDRITEAFRAAAHGAIGPEISEYHDTDEEACRAYDEVIRAVFDGYRVDPPTTID